MAPEGRDILFIGLERVHRADPPLRDFGERPMVFTLGRRGIGGALIIICVSLERVTPRASRDMSTMIVDFVSFSFRILLGLFSYPQVAGPNFVQPRTSVVDAREKLGERHRLRMADPGR